MPISRLRLQLAAWFALVSLAGLGAVDFALFTYLRRNADAHFTQLLDADADGVTQAVRRELVDMHGEFKEAVAEALGEWPQEPGAIVVYAADGTVMGLRGPAAMTSVVPTFAQLPPGDRTWDVPFDREGSLRLTMRRSAATPGFSVVMARPTASLHEANETIALWLTLSAPLVVLLALGGGYVLARRALAPLSAMTSQITAIDSRALDRRLPVRSPPDELDTLADQFNRLIERLSFAQARNRRFLAQVAHQLRTPLTVIRGESTLGLERSRSSEEHRDLLKRVSLAAEQMSHRVDDLFLLAQAEAGDTPPLTDHIEVDGLVLECVDLMRGRAGALGRRLDLGTMDAAELTGNEALVREAVLELLENACRHGESATAIRISIEGGNGTARVQVSSGGPAVAQATLAETPQTARAEGPGLGLSIVRWIAAVHGGRLAYRHETGLNAFTLELATHPSANGGS